MMNDEKPVEEMSVEQAEGEINATLGDYNHVYWARKDHPLHSKAVDRMKELHEKAFPKEPEPPKKSKETHYDAGSADDLGLKESLEGLTEEEIAASEAKRKEIEEAEDLDLSPEEKAGLAELEREWGSEYKERVAAAVDVVDRLVERRGGEGEELRDMLEESKMGNDPRMIRFLYWIVEEFGDDIK
jgi:predicted house-cleaning noncanonical NTP pyrophosphatase (MazG superfamily)